MPPCATLSAHVHTLLDKVSVSSVGVLGIINKNLGIQEQPQSDVKTTDNEQEESHMEKTRQAPKSKCGCLIPPFVCHGGLIGTQASSASQVHPEVSTVESLSPLHCSVGYVVFHTFNSLPVHCLFSSSDSFPNSSQVFEAVGQMRQHQI